MDVGTALSVAQTLFATLQCAEVRKLCSVFNYESELEKLLKTVETINSFLLDASSKWQELSHGGQCLVQNLKNAVYDADDLFDEYRTIAKQLNGMPGGKLSKKVRRFFSSKNPLLFAYKTSVEVKKLREELDSLSKNHRNFGFSELYKPVKDRVETDYYVYEHDIIGRDADKKEIVDLLLRDDSEKDISFVTVVGIGGLGKTTLAQLVYSDHRIKAAFEGNMYWVCVSFDFDTKNILGKMIRGELGFEDVRRKSRNQIEGKRYFLVLDDVWCEDGMKWDDLKNFLKLGGKGSRILVTSRSQKVATAIGNYPMHKLQGLSEKDSWELFRKISLAVKEDEVIAGIDIVKKCANVPLSIRVVASLLRGQDINAWQSYRRIDLAKMRDDEDNLMPILMFSYYHLDPALKSCFSFCSVFPQDHKIYKENLISLWSAHGYLVPSVTDNSIEDTGERYFSILLHRCFFQDVEKNDNGGIESVKMHDLIHDLARKVAGKESVTLKTCSTFEYEGNARHLFFDSNKCLVNWSSSSNCTSKTLRTFCKKFHGFNDVEVWSSIILKCSRLRVLSIQRSQFYRFPNTLGSLLHLRYLDLSYNFDLEMLPTSITKLHNLQTLNLVYCRKLKELPEDTWKLVNLRVLHMDGCERLTHLPSWASRLVSIRLTECDELLDLPLSLSQLCHLKYLTLGDMQSMEYIESDVDAPSPSAKFFPCLEELQLIHMPKLKGLWKNKTWMETEIVSIPSFPRLYKLYIKHCKSLTYIPQCPHLKQLKLCSVNSLLMENFQICTSLQHLYINNSSAIKILRKEHLTKLNFLKIRACYPIEPLLEAIKHLTSLTTLEIKYCPELKSLPEAIKHLTSLTTLVIEDCEELKSLPEAIKHLTSLTTLEIEKCPELKSLPEAIKHLTSLNTLKIKKSSPELKDRCQEPDGEDWLKICHIPNIYIEERIREALSLEEYKRELLTNLRHYVAVVS